MNMSSARHPSLEKMSVLSLANIYDACHLNIFDDINRLLFIPCVCCVSYSWTREQLFYLGCILHGGSCVFGFVRVCAWMFAKQRLNFSLFLASVCFTVANFSYGFCL